MTYEISISFDQNLTGIKIFHTWVKNTLQVMISFPQMTRLIYIYSCDRANVLKRIQTSVLVQYFLDRTI